jgi:ABC-type multidrug transport system permease subunit
MKEIIGGAVAAILMLSVVILLTTLSTFFGGVGGLIVGLFTETIMDTLARFGVDTVDMTMWQLGASLGFVSGFFKSAKIERKQ